MTYYLYHIPGKKVGVTTNLEERVHKQQGYYPGEYEIIETSDDIEFISEGEIIMQKFYGYRVDDVLYSELMINKNKDLNMNINVTEQTTTFPCPVNKLKGQLMDNIGMQWETEHGDLDITPDTIKWIMNNVKISKYNSERCYVYNKAFARYYDNNNPYQTTLADLHMRDQYNGKTKSGALSPAGIRQEKCKPECNDRFDLIREWAEERGLYLHGDTKTQTLKLIEEAGEICRAVLKDNQDDIIDGIGDCVVVLTNLAELHGVKIEQCIDMAYDEIKNRTGKMSNGTFKKD
jgi:NTP pyrophosphatase (non-canonical NTP hydrolase)